MRYASAKRRVLGNPLRMTIVPRTKTYSVILKILKILIQNQVTAGEYYIGPRRREDVSIASLLGIQKPDETDDLVQVSIVSQIGKCICIMGGRMPFAHTKMDYFQCDPNLKILIQGYLRENILPEYTTPSQPNQLQV